MLVLRRTTQRWEDRAFREFPQFLQPGDCLVLNNSKVFPARLLGHRAGVHSLPVGKNNPKLRENLSGEAEVLLIEPVSHDAKTWTALVHPGRKMRTGERIWFSPPDGSLEGPSTHALEAEILARSDYGERTLRFHYDGDIYAAFDKIGHVPLPPYMKRPDAPSDRERYQTVFARERGSVAAPTAGLHFTPEVLDECRRSGAEIAYVTLHVGLGTFQPVRGESLHAERFLISAENAGKIRDARRVVCVGTTGVRSVESAALGKSGSTDLFIRPGFEFRRTGALLTNFHLPQSSLLMLVCAFAGHDFTLAAYQHAVESGYRFYSYGDCMLIVD